MAVVTSANGHPLHQTAAPTFVRDRLTLAISIALLSGAAIAWIATFYLTPVMSMNSTDARMMTMGVASMVTSLSLTSIALFEVIWVIGMAAMMFPAMLPIVLFYNRVATKVESDPKKARAAGTPLFLLGYLATYAGLGLVAYVAIFFALGVGSSSLANSLPSLALRSWLFSRQASSWWRRGSISSPHSRLSVCLTVSRHSVFLPSTFGGVSREASGWALAMVCTALAAVGLTCS